MLDVDGEEPQLRALASHYAAKGGALWIAGADGAVAGMVAVSPLADDGTWEIGRLYVASGLRGGGLAHRLLDAAEAHAACAGATRLVLWSDTRFATAHAFYEKRSYLRAGPIRALGDRSHSLEFRFEKPLTGLVVRALGAAEAASAVRQLAVILRDCVEAGASVSFLPPLPLAEARAHFAATAAAVARGERRLLVAWLAGMLVGTVGIDLALPQNQPHRAEVQKLLVAPSARRRRVARALMLAAEETAAEAGRALLTLDTRVGDAGEALYRGLGWIEAGTIPGYALNADLSPCDTRLYYKRLGGG